MALKKRFHRNYDKLPCAHFKHTAYGNVGTRAKRSFENIFPQSVSSFVHKQFRSIYLKLAEKELDYATSSLCFNPPPFCPSTSYVMCVASLIEPTYMLFNRLIFFRSAREQWFRLFKKPFPQAYAFIDTKNDVSKRKATIKPKHFYAKCLLLK